MSSFDTAPIAAIATAPGRGGIGVIRVSGLTLEPLITELFSQTLTPRFAHYLPFKDINGEVIDLGLALFFKAPHSYTGEDVLELHGHGGSAVLNRLLTRTLEAGQPNGVRLAQPGEFSLRAFLNNKIDLTQAEAIADLIDATSVAAAKAAAGSLTGQFSEKIKNITQAIVHLRTLVEATLDFPEEEIEFIEQYQVKQKLTTIDHLVQTLIKTSTSSLALKDGLRVVLMGEPNVGKSSLLNALCGESVAIVTDIAGTTRDRIAQDLNIDGVPITLIDTAGLRDTVDQIEILGIERTWQEINQADVILHVIDVSNQNVVINKQYQKWVSIGINHRSLLNLTLLNKCDLVDHQAHNHTANKSSHSSEDHNNDCIYVSAKTGLGLDALKAKLLTAAGRTLGESSPWQGRTRHIRALKIAQTHLLHAQEYLFFEGVSLDIVAEELRLTHHALGEITGKIYADDLLGEIFSNFCIGK
jgi:tRNA modification GTPase